MLLWQILARITRGGTWTIKSLAKELGTTSSLVTLMVKDLERLGYLKRVAGTPGICGGVCASCLLDENCVKGSSQKVWTLVRHVTEKEDQRLADTGPRKERRWKNDLPS